MYGKTLGNGYAITAVVGKREIMEAAQKTFISSTFWTERIGPSAAIASLEIMKKERSWERISSIGEIIQKNWKLISERQKVGIKIQGIPALSTFTFEHSDHLKFKTFLSQELLKNGYLGTTAFYSSISHSDKILVRYFQVLEEIFYEISKCVNGSSEIDSMLKYPVAHSGFRRLN